MVLFPKKKKTSTWPSTIAGVLSSGCPRFFKSGQKEFNRETGWWALQENVAPAIKLSEGGSVGSKRKRKRGYSPLVSKSKTSSNVNNDQPLEETQPSCTDENTAQV